MLMLLGKVLGMLVLHVTCIIPFEGTVPVLLCSVQDDI